MDKIKTPIEWNERAEEFLDADGYLLTVEAVVKALNTAADQSRVIEVMSAGINYVRIGLETEIHHSTDPKSREHAQQLFQHLDKVLAEAKRIMEGK